MRWPLFFFSQIGHGTLALSPPSLVSHTFFSSPCANCFLVPSLLPVSCNPKLIAMSSIMSPDDFLIDAVRKPPTILKSRAGIFTLGAVRGGVCWTGSYGFWNSVVLSPFVSCFAQWLLSCIPCTNQQGFNCGAQSVNRLRFRPAAFLRGVTKADHMTWGCVRLPINVRSKSQLFSYFCEWRTIKPIRDSIKIHHVCFSYYHI